MTWKLLWLCCLTCERVWVHGSIADMKASPPYFNHGPYLPLRTAALSEMWKKKNPEKKILPDKRQLHSFTIQESLQNRKPYYISLCYQSQHNKLSVQMVFQQEMNPYLTSEPHHFDKMQKSRCFILVTLCQTPSFGLRMIQESCSVCLRGTDWRWWGKNML